MTGQGKDEQEEGTDEDPASLFFEAETFEEIAQQYDSTEEYDLDTGHVQAIVFPMHCSVTGDGWKNC